MTDSRCGVEEFISSLRDNKDLNTDDKLKLLAVGVLRDYKWFYNSIDQYKEDMRSMVSGGRMPSFDSALDTLIQHTEACPERMFRTHHKGFLVIIVPYHGMVGGEDEGVPDRRGERR